VPKLMRNRLRSSWSMGRSWSPRSSAAWGTCRRSTPTAPRASCAERRHAPPRQRRDGHMQQGTCRTAYPPALCVSKHTRSPAIRASEVRARKPAPSRSRSKSPGSRSSRGRSRSRDRSPGREAASAVRRQNVACQPQQFRRSSPRGCQNPSARPMGRSTHRRRARRR
jgi:hypothetical protein